MKASNACARIRDETDRLDDVGYHSVRVLAKGQKHPETYQIIRSKMAVMPCVAASAIFLGALHPYLPGSQASGAVLR
ncbi:MAG TPA: hypothetical protein VKF36_20970 [Syntrophorhabdales bacterium]|nr:hypothetical protein [Syntrophorhabdales bacterium]